MNLQGGPKTGLFMTVHNIGKNDIPQFAIHQNVAFFRGENDCCKINNLFKADWLNILCKRSGVKQTVSKPRSGKSGN